MRQDLNPTAKHSSRGHRKSTSLRFFCCTPAGTRIQSWSEADRVIPRKNVIPQRSRPEKSDRPCNPFRFGRNPAGHGLRSCDGLVDRCGQRRHRRPSKGKIHRRIGMSWKTLVRQLLREVENPRKEPDGSTLIVPVI
jgi:hypothetical protein